MADLTSLFFLAVWISMLAVVTSVPVQDTPHLAKRDGTSIKAIHNHSPKRIGALEYYRTLNKHKLPIPDDLMKVVDRYTAKIKASNKVQNQHPDGHVGSYPIEGDLEWLCPASIGTPPQQLYLDFDTGSADTWTFSTDTEKSQVEGQVLYDPDRSSTSALVPNATWSILYGDFSSSQGIVYTDTFTIGDIPIPNMTIESAQEVSLEFTQQKQMSGLVGLGWPIMIETVPMMPSLLDFFKNALKSSLFTVDLKHNSSEGSFNFGYIDEELHGSKIEYVDIDNSEGYWAAKMTGFATGGSQFRYEFSYPPSIIIDTGSTLFYAPDDAVSEYFRSVPGGNYSYSEYGYVLPCNSTPPDFWWEMGDSKGHRISGTVPGAYMLYAVLEDGVMCYSGLQSLSGFSDLQGIFGDVFLKSGFEVFDVGRKRFGYAPKLLGMGGQGSGPGIQRRVAPTPPESFKARKSILLG